MALAAELQREGTVAGYGEILVAHAGWTGSGLTWELQLPAGACAASAGAAL
jgi:hypothetical protein